MTLREIVTDLKNLLRGGALVSDDEPVSDRQVAFWVHTTRAYLIRQQTNKGQSVSDNIIQTISCVPIEQVNASTDPDLESDCFIVRTTQVVPNPLEVNQEDLLFKVSSPQIGTITYTQLPMAAIPYASYNKFGKGIPKAWSENGYIYILNMPFGITINLTGVWENPEDLSHFSDCTGKSCFTWDDPYPISAHMIDTLKKVIIETHFKLLIKPLVDDTNNAQFNLEQPESK